MPAISVKGVCRRCGKVTALDDVSFEVADGMILDLLAPNGSGKTTTVGVLSTALLPDEGSASVGGLDVVADAAAVRSVIGFAGQFAAVDPNLTGRENLVLIGRLSLLAFSSAAFVPLHTMPGWLQALGSHQPVTALVNAERALVLGGPAEHFVLDSLAWSCGLLVGFAFLASMTYRGLARS